MNEYLYGVIRIDCFCPGQFGMNDHCAPSARVPSPFINAVLRDVPGDFLISNPKYMNFRTDQIWWGSSAFVFTSGNKIRPGWIDPELGFTILQYKQ